jgi:hypothetical protein
MIGKAQGAARSGQVHGGRAHWAGPRGQGAGCRVAQSLNILSGELHFIFEYCNEEKSKKIKAVFYPFIPFSS